MPVESLARPPVRLALPVRAPAPRKVVCFQEARTRCSSCGVRRLCLPAGLGAETLGELEAAFGDPMRLRKREVLYRGGERFTALYAIHLGTFKTVMLAEDGREQITGYHMAADIVGLDGLGEERHACDAIALEDSEVCAVFLLNLAERYQRRGFSASELTLRMTREEIASYLGLKLETVSRLFSRLQGEGHIQVEGRAIKLLDPAALRRMVGQPA